MSVNLLRCRLRRCCLSLIGHRDQAAMNFAICSCRGPFPGTHCLKGDMGRSLYLIEMVAPITFRTRSAGSDGWLTWPLRFFGEMP